MKKSPILTKTSRIHVICNLKKNDIKEIVARTQS